MTEQTKPIKIAPLFPIPLGMFDLEPISESVILHLKNLEVIKNLGNYRSMRSDLHHDHEMHELFKTVTEHCQNFFNTIYQPLNENEIYITSAWCNYTEKGQIHHTHKHSNSFISGVIYLQTTTDDSVEFYSPYNDREIIDVCNKEYNLYNSSSWEIPVYDNLLILFPSWIYHSVPIKSTTGTRIALSFNTFLRGLVGQETQLTHLTLS